MAVLLFYSNRVSFSTVLRGQGVRGVYATSSLQALIVIDCALCAGVQSLRIYITLTKLVKRNLCGRRRGRRQSMTSVVGVFFCSVQMNISTVENFLARLQRGYSKHSNPYHNLVHAADVTQTMNYLISRSGLAVGAAAADTFYFVFCPVLYLVSLDLRLGQHTVLTCTCTCMLISGDAVALNAYLVAKTCQVCS